MPGSFLLLVAFMVACDPWGGDNDTGSSNWLPTHEEMAEFYCEGTTDCRYGGYGDLPCYERYFDGLAEQRAVLDEKAEELGIDCSTDFIRYEDCYTYYVYCRDGEPYLPSSSCDTPRNDYTECLASIGLEPTADLPLP